MDEAAWLACREPQEMLDWLRDNGRPDERRRRLFACAGVRRVWHLLEDERSRKAVEVVERHVDGQACDEELIAATLAAMHALRAAMTPACQNANRPRTARCAAALAARRCYLVGDAEANVSAAGLAAEALARATYPGASLPDEPAGLHPFSRHFSRAMQGECAAQAELLRDLFGNPFRPLAIGPSLLTWSGGLLPQLARAAYDHRLLPEGMLDPARLAVLCDALEESGLAGLESLNHLRGGPYWRGCHVLDALLGRA